MAGTIDKLSLFILLSLSITTTAERNPPMKKKTSTEKNAEGHNVTQPGDSIKVTISFGLESKVKVVR